MHSFSSYWRRCLAMLELCRAPLTTVGGFQIIKNCNRSKNVKEKFNWIEYQIFLIISCYFSEHTMPFQNSLYSWPTHTKRTSNGQKLTRMHMAFTLSLLWEIDIIHSQTWVLIVLCLAVNYDPFTSQSILNTCSVVKYSAKTELEISNIIFSN